MKNNTNIVVPDNIKNKTISDEMITIGNLLELLIPEVKLVRHTATRIKALLPCNVHRDETMRILIANKFQPDRHIKGSSIGGVKLNGIEVIFKDADNQGRTRIGVENEIILIEKINEFTSQGVHSFRFNGENKSIIYHNIERAISVGSEFTNGRKADLKLITGNGEEIPISIKKDNATRWESPNVRFHDVASKFCNNIVSGAYKHTHNLTVVPRPLYLKREITIKRPRSADLKKMVIDEDTLYYKDNIFHMVNTSGDLVSGVYIEGEIDNQTVFGSDKCVVIYNTFSQYEGFELIDNVCNISTSKIIQDDADLLAYDLTPVLMFRHDKTQGNGIRSEIIYNSAAVKAVASTRNNSIKMTMNDIVNLK